MLSSSMSLLQWYYQQQVDRWDYMDRLTANLSDMVDVRLTDVDYSMHTVRLIQNSAEPGISDALYEWEFGSSQKQTEDRLHELIMFCVPYHAQVGKTMLLFALWQTKKSHPMFRRFLESDLTEMDDDEYTAFKQVFAFLIDIYIQRRSPFMRSVESTIWGSSPIPLDPANHFFGTPTPKLVDFILDHPDRADDIARYMVDREFHYSNTETDGILAYLDSCSRVLAEGAL